MSGEGLSSPLMIRYQKTLEHNPRSRVFAPLAESYRRLGMIDKSVEILKDGIRYNPNYVLGYLGMAFCYVDMKKDSLAYATLRPLVETNRDNIRLQKLFAKVCEKIGYYDEALETYKYLLFINPKDSHIASIIREIEEKSGGEKAVISPTKAYEHEYLDEIFDADKIDVNIENDIDDWTAVDFTVQQDQVEEEEEIIEPAKEKIIESQQESVDDKSGDIPVVTHTLVDIYCAQGYFVKAKEVLEKILELDPLDEKTSKKLEEVELKIEKHEQKQDEGHSHLMNLIDEKFGSKDDEQVKIAKKKFDKFHDMLKKRAAKAST